MHTCIYIYIYICISLYENGLFFMGKLNMFIGSLCIFYRETVYLYREIMFLIICFLKTCFSYNSASTDQPL